ncbi:DUF4846 domain-containing protein [Alkaliphilus peptidifermentans]|uniref:DUF4846 domain-containing protein n=1 Tax=Alkaliphilus peptidifermentans DSM 18978 TaxID=1120976 RepID=A0A1G5AU87_9FIRM|nr:DUF4846 domain-containing protein [Alkaliphilus peptidifermentans]SCX81478.1 protein of unknown function (4846) [Alkaliphilus peptidifermentans DSM 18978]
MKKIIIVLSLLMLVVSCQFRSADDHQTDKPLDVAPISEVGDSKQELINIEGKIIEDRFNVPEGFTRIEITEDSFGAYLRNLPLKAHDSRVLYYDGREKNKPNVYDAVVDMDLGNRDLQQCADAIIRLRAEYFYGKGEYDKIHFNFTNGFRVDYTKWMDGYRISVVGNEVSWVKRAEASNTYDDFRKYLDIVFAYAGTISLSQELHPVAVEEMEIGDVFIQGGSPGHAVIVVDMAENIETGEKLFLLAQSYMPAQDTQILINPMDKELSPWYSLNFGETLYTPEWTFSRRDLKRF